MYNLFLLILPILLLVVTFRRVETDSDSKEDNLDAGEGFFLGMSVDQVPFTCYLARRLCFIAHVSHEVVICNRFNLCYTYTLSDTVRDLINLYHL